MNFVQRTIAENEWVILGAENGRVVIDTNKTILTKNILLIKKAATKGIYLENHQTPSITIKRFLSENKIDWKFKQFNVVIWLKPEERFLLELFSGKYKSNHSSESYDTIARVLSDEYDMKIPEMEKIIKGSNNTKLHNLYLSHFNKENYKEFLTLGCNLMMGVIPNTLQKIRLSAEKQRGEALRDSCLKTGGLYFIDADRITKNHLSLSGFRV